MENMKGSPISTTRTLPAHILDDVLCYQFVSVSLLNWQNLNETCYGYLEQLHLESYLEKMKVKQALSVEKQNCLQS